MNLDDLFPSAGRALLNAGGRDFIEKLGINTVRQVIIDVLCGDNLRTRTEPLTRQRVSLVSGALISMFAKGIRNVPNFFDSLSEIAVEQLRAKGKSNKASIWPAQWLVGLTGKSTDNVLRGNTEFVARYIQEFEAAVGSAATTCQVDYGDVELYLRSSRHDSDLPYTLTWNDIIRITTAIGSATLTIRGSDKSTYGKLFERLILGSALSVLGFSFDGSQESELTQNIFWLSDSSDDRECDATAIIRPGCVARFDIGFIGNGNPEITKDKLSRYSRDFEKYGSAYSSRTFVIIDRLPKTSKTTKIADQTGTQLIQMSMQYWIKDLALSLHDIYGHQTKILTMKDEDIKNYLSERLRDIPFLAFINHRSSRDDVHDFEEPGYDE
jgi:hypothetical protein